MPSKDTFHEKRPEMNAWHKVRSSTRTRRAAVLVPIAARLGKTPDELAEKIPEDTIRRLAYPVAQIEHADGTVEYLDPRTPARR